MSLCNLLIITSFALIKYALVYGVLLQVAGSFVPSIRRIKFISIEVIHQKNIILTYDSCCFQAGSFVPSKGQHSPVGLFSIGKIVAKHGREPEEVVGVDSKPIRLISVDR